MSKNIKITPWPPMKRYGTAIKPRIETDRIEATGALAVNRTAMTADANTSATTLYIGWDGGGADTLTIKSADIAVAGRLFIVKDEGGTASANPLTIATEGSEKIDGQDTIQLVNDYGYVWLISNGSHLFVVNEG